MEQSVHMQASRVLEPSFAAEPRVLVEDSAQSPLVSPNHPKQVIAYEWGAMAPFLIIHAIGLFGWLYTGVTRGAVIAGIVLYWVRMFAVTGGYHRYFSHRTFKTSRFFQFILAILAQTTAQRGVLW